MPLTPGTRLGSEGITTQIWFWGGPSSSEPLRRFMGGLLTDGGGLAEPIVTSVIVATLIDGGCRVCARLRYARDVRRRSRAIAMLLYAAAFGLVVMGPLFWLVVLTPAVAVMIGPPRGAFAGMLLVLLIVAAPFAASWPVLRVYNDQEIISQLPVEVIRSSLAVVGGFVTVPPHGSGLIEASADPKHKMRSNDLPAQARPERCRLVKMDERRPLWLGEPKGGFFDLFPSLGSFRPWPDPSQETSDGSGAVDDRRAAH